MSTRTGLIGLALILSWQYAAWSFPCYLGEALRLAEGTVCSARPRQSQLLGTQRSLFTVDTTSREEVRNFFNAVYAESENVDPEWTGDVSTCSSGTTSERFRNAVLLRVNWVRALAGVPAWVTFDHTYNTKAQQMALMLSANRAASHYPPPTWKCYTEDGAEAAANSNLALGSYGPDAIVRYIEDFGSFNSAVGHRRWILYPQTRVMGTGDIPSNPHGPPSNTLWILDSYANQVRPATREPYVAWPPPGYVPYQVVFARWSFAYPKADFSAATVTMASNGVPCLLYTS
ncbi:MAG: CAP domain-containing protein, partial [Verrucomicrobiae bacterium]|nr:CAP domain-containing protein [Verrucomicrobiae bacterium]